ncbi:MAG: Ldh family oxidoreductase [Spirochaetaceae bacterium]
MESTQRLIPFETLERFVNDVFLRLGVPPEDARICADVLLQSDLRGIDSHGIGRLAMYHDRIRAGIQSPTTEIETLRETETTATLDGHHGMGHVIAYRAMRTAMEKAAAYGMGAVAVRNSTHYGFAGYYPLMATREDMLGLTVTNARPGVAPTFGVRPMIGTNPLSFGAPTDLPFSFLIDAATSITQRGKLEHLHRRDQPTPEGWVIGHDGRPRTDTGPLLSDLVAGTAAMLPLGGIGETFGGHKGYGYGTMVEILSAALSGGAYLWDLTGLDERGDPRPYRLGHFFLAIDIAHFIDPPAFRRIATGILRELQRSPKAPGHDRIYVAGEKEHESEQRRRASGIPVNDTLAATLDRVGTELDLGDYRFF